MLSDEHVMLVHTVPLSNSTISRRTECMSYNTERQTQNELTSEFKANSCTQTHGPSDPEAE